MWRRCCCSLVVFVFVASVGLAGYPTNRFNIRLVRGTLSRTGCLTLYDGRLIVGRCSLGSVGDNQNAPDRWYIEGTRIKCSTGGEYLTYDPTGKDSGVFVVAKPPEGIDWKVTLKRREGSERGVLEAATGAMKGWSLDIEVPPPPPPGISPAPAAASGRLILSKEPWQPSVVERIYGHK